MHKIIEAIKKMITNSKKITDVALGASASEPNEEYFFLYDNKYKWSIMLVQTETVSYNLYYYPHKQSIEELAARDNWKAEEYVVYKSTEFDSNESKLFENLYSFVREKLYRIDEALEDIIKGAS